MSNIFKNASRFSILNEDIEETGSNNKRERYTKPNNNTKPNNTRNNLNNTYDSNVGDKKNRFNYDPEKEKQKLKALNDEKIKKNLDISSFPEIGQKNNIFVKNVINENENENEIGKPSFLDKLNYVKEEKKEETEEPVKDGCVSITLVNGKIKYKYGNMLFKMTQCYYLIKP